MTNQELYVNELLALRFKLLAKFRNRFSTNTLCGLANNEIDLRKNATPKLLVNLFGINNEQIGTSDDHLIAVIKELQHRGSDDKQFVYQLQTVINKLKE